MFCYFYRFQIYLYDGAAAALRNERECEREEASGTRCGGGRKVHWPSFASSVAVSKEHEVMNLPPPTVYIPAMGDARASVPSFSIFVYTVITIIIIIYTF